MWVLQIRSQGRASHLAAQSGTAARRQGVDQFQSASSVSSCKGKILLDDLDGGVEAAMQACVGGR